MTQLSFTDQQLINAARACGLCLPDCWQLDYDEEAQRFDQHWIDEAGSPSERADRQGIFDATENQRLAKLEVLRSFARRVIELQVSHQS